MAQIHQTERELAEVFSVMLKEYERQYVLWDEECKSLKKSLQKAVRQKEGWRRPEMNWMNVSEMNRLSL
jgi:hypothetical protein